MKNILIVCTANICRSPMAEGLLNALIEESGMENSFRVSSAGTWGMQGLPAAEGTIAVLRSMGIEKSNHLSRIVSSQILDQADLVLTMESSHAEALRAEFPHSAKKIMMLSEILEKKYDIADPIGEPIEAFVQTASEIDRIFREGFDKMIELI